VRALRDEPAALRGHGAPLRHRRPRPEPEKAQDRRGEDRAGHGQRRDDDEGIIAFQIPGPSAATIAMASRICGEPRSGEAFGRRPRRLAGILDLFQGSWVVAMVPHKRHMGRSSRERAPGGFAKGSEGCAESGTLGCSLRERHHGLPPSLGGEFTVPDTSCHAGVALTSCAVPR
jgi:hypothetical protein